MKTLYEGMMMSLSMFSVLPAPQIWNDKAAAWAAAFLPLVGLLLGALWYGAALLMLWLGLPLLLHAALLFLCPLLLSGFIHIDGFMDTSDAVFSRAAAEKKREILKDPHVGAFAVIALGIYLLLGFCAFYTAMQRGADLRVLPLIPLLSRAAAALALLYGRPLSPSGYGAMFSRDSGRAQKLLLLVLLLLGVAAAVMLGAAALITAAALLVGAILAGYGATRQLGGISGDLCGFIITSAELAALLALALARV